MELIPFSRIFKCCVVGVSTIIIISCSSLHWESTSPDDQQMLADNSYLASDKLKGRTFGSEGEIKAGDYIAKRFAELGLKPKGENNTWFQSLTVKKATPHDFNLQRQAKRVQAAAM